MGRLKGIYRDMTEFYSAVEKKKVTFVGKWMELESAVLRKTSQTRLRKTDVSFHFCACVTGGGRGNRMHVHLAGQKNTIRN